MTMVSTIWGTRRRRAAVVLALAVVVLAWMSRRPAVVVQAAEVSRGALVVTVTTNGKVEPIADFEMRARLDGRVLEVVDPGTHVAAGAAVARLDGEATAAALAAAQAERRAAEEELRVARESAARAKDRLAVDQRLQAQGALTRERAAESLAELRAAEARLAFLEHDVPLRTADLDRRIVALTAARDSATVTAPVAGTVYRTQAKKGEMAHVGDPLVWIADLDRLRVRTNVDQVDLGRVAIGQPIRVTSNAFPGRSWSGRVTSITPNVVARDNRALAEALADVDPPLDGLVPGMTVDVEITVSDGRDVLQVSADAIVGDQQQPFVYRIDGHRVRRTAVRIGRTTPTVVEIVEGLAAGDRVVASPPPGLTDRTVVDVARP